MAKYCWCWVRIGKGETGLSKVRKGWKRVGLRRAT